MSRIDDMVAELAPAGVPYRPMWELTTWDKRFNAVDRKKQPAVRKYRYLLANEIPPLVTEDGDVKLLTTNVSSLWTSEQQVGYPVHDEEVIAIPWGGNAIVQHYRGRFVTSDNRIAVANNPGELDMKFLYYYIQANISTLASFYRGSGIKHPSMAKVLDWPIPVPPLEVQREIVRILDQFTQLEAELEAELEARRRQYEHYRKTLIAATEATTWTTLGEAVNNFDSKRRPVTRAQRDAGEYPYYGANGVQDSVADYLFDGTYLLLGEDGSVLQKDGSPVVNWAEGKIWVNNHAHVLQAREGFSLRYLFHYLQTIDISPLVTGGTQPKLNQRNMNRIPVPIVGVEVQEEISAKLDSFDALVNDLSVGLPAELAARRKQYEYYRDKLLTFKELPA